MATTFTVGTEVVFCERSEDRRAQITEVSATGEVLGIVVLSAGGHIERGVQNPKLAKTPQERILDGYFRARV